MIPTPATDGDASPEGGRPPSLLPHIDLMREADRVRDAAEQLHQTGIKLPVVGWRMPVPPPELLTFYAGLATLAAIEVIEWPLAVVIAVGHELARSRRPGLRGLAESVESV